MKANNITAVDTDLFVALASLSNPEHLIDPRVAGTSGREILGGRGLSAEFWGEARPDANAYNDYVRTLSHSSSWTPDQVLRAISLFNPAAMSTRPENLLRPLIKQASSDDLNTLAHGLYFQYDALVADDKRIGDDNRSDSMYSIISDIWSEITKRYASHRPDTTTVIDRDPDSGAAFVAKDHEGLKLSHMLINFCQTFEKIPVADDAVDGERQLADLILNAAEQRLTTLLSVLATKIIADRELGIETGIRNLFTTIEQAKQRIPANLDESTKKSLENSLESILQNAFDSNSLQ